MKKIAPIAIIALFALASCKKEYTCECTVTLTGSSTSTVVSGKTGKVSKKDAKASCDNGDYTNAAGTSNCEIK